MAPATRIGQVLLPVVEQAELADAVALAERGLIGGVVVIGKPDEGVTDAIDSLHASSMTGRLVIAVDEEGGNVQRLDGLLGLLPSAFGLTELEPRQVRVVIADRMAAMADLGFTVNLAPVFDVGAGPGIGSRSFGDEPGVVVTYGRAFADGVLDGGIFPVAKHFPGHGRADTDSHDDLPTTPPLEEMSDFDLVPWRGLTDRIGVMVGHLDVPGLTEGMPASLSPEAITGLLRTELEFDGVVLVDDLEMGAIEEITTLPKAAVLALAAGADLLITGAHYNVIPAAWEIVTALDDGRLSEERLGEAVERVFALRGVDPCTMVS
ncbi:MAG: glycoside hydrolase family 3 protein [Actinomycetia bacterium]|nr:glycoside hydrolase family 3 protein [Actinomycetes bacterium]